MMQSCWCRNLQWRLCWHLKVGWWLWDIPNQCPGHRRTSLGPWHQPALYGREGRRCDHWATKCIEMQQTCSVDDQWVFNWETFGGLTSPLGSWQLGSALVAASGICRSWPLAAHVWGQVWLPRWIFREPNLWSRWYSKTVGTGNHWKTKGAKNDQTGESSSLLIVTHAIAIADHSCISHDITWGCLKIG